MDLRSIGTLLMKNKLLTLIIYTFTVTLLSYTIHMGVLQHTEVGLICTRHNRLKS